MRIYVLGSNSFVKEMVDCKNLLCKMGHDGFIHPDYEAYVRGEKPDHLQRIFGGEAAAVKRENDYLKSHYRHILESEAILIVNLEKKGNLNYIGGNCLIEMGQAYVNNKKIFLLTEIPQNSAYLDEINAMDPICLHGDLENLSLE